MYGGAIKCSTLGVPVSLGVPTAPLACYAAWECSIRESTTWLAPSSSLIPAVFHSVVWPEAWKDDLSKYGLLIVSRINSLSKQR